MFDKNITELKDFVSPVEVQENSVKRETTIVTNADNELSENGVYTIDLSDNTSSYDLDGESLW